MKRLLFIQLKRTAALLMAALCLLCLLPGAVLAEGAEGTNPVSADAEADGNKSSDSAGDGEKLKGFTEEEAAALQAEWERQLLAMLDSYNADPDSITAGYYNFETGEEHYFHPDEYRISGSMYKVPLNMLYLDWIDEGELDPDPMIGAYSYRQLLEGTIIHSDNDMAKILWDYAGAKLENGPGTLYHRYRILIAPLMGEDPDNVDDKYYENNFFTARQMLHCLKELYNGGEKYAPLIETMQRAEPEKYFKLRERRFNIGHKYGWFAEGDTLYLNDCAICYTDDPIAIVLFTSGTNNAYGVVTQFCTLMCDYTQEQHALRIAKEEEEAAARERELEQQLIEEERAKLLAEAENPLPGEEAEAGVESGLVNGTVQKNGEDGTGSDETESRFYAVLRAVRAFLGQHRLRVISLPGTVALVSALCLAIALGAVLRSIGARGGVAFLISLLLAILAAGFVLAANGLEMPLVYEKTESPREAVDRFFDALKRGDDDAADACLVLDGEEEISRIQEAGMDAAVSGENAEKALKALRESWDYGFAGECRTEKTKARQPILLRTIDFRKMETVMKRQTRLALLDMAQAMSRNAVYEANGEAKPEMAEKAYNQAFAELMGEPEVFYTVTELDLDLVQDDGSWRIVLSPALLGALTGSISGA